MAATNFKTENNTFRKLLGNGLTYRVPPFQRDYSWGEEEWEDLWQDILGTLRPGGEPSHYMGYLVLRSGDDKNFDVIDGQQRLTTLSLVVLAALKHLRRLIDRGVDVERTKQRLEQLRSAYVGYLDPVTLIARSKLTLNRNNDHYYQTYIVPLAESLPQRGFRASDQLLRRGFEWFERRIEEYVRGQAEVEAGMAVAVLVDGLSDRLFFTVITVSDELNAYKVFETLNARGVRLSATDLLKNHLFSVLHRSTDREQELRVLEDRWEHLVDRLGPESFPEFLRVHWNSRHQAARQSELFKVVRERIQTRDAAFGLLRDLDEDLETYLALTQPEQPGWPREWREAIDVLRMFRIRQPFPLLLAAKRRLSTEDFGTVLHACVPLSFRYNIIVGQHTADQERVYNGTALRIANGSLTDADSVLESLREVYVRDPAFKAAFQERAMRISDGRYRKIVRYILAQLERHLGPGTPDTEDAGVSVEHVLPENPGPGWEVFDDRLQEAMVHRLGNLALLEAAANRDAGNASYAMKREAYSRSSFELTRRIPRDAESWTPEAIDARQRSMAKMAAAVWKVQALSGP